MPRCTRRSARAVPGTRSSTCASSIGPTNGRDWSATCAAHRRAASCVRSTNRSSTPPTGGSPASKRSCAGRIPSRGVVMPDVLIPIAEQSGLIIEIGRWVLEQACPDRHRWQSLRHRRPHDVGQCVGPATHGPRLRRDRRATCSTRPATDPHLVTLEVTESVFVQDSQRALVVLNELKELGVTLALDDFGTGYSSLNYLKRFPIDIVKIDQGFVADLGRRPGESRHHLLGGRTRAPARHDGRGRGRRDRRATRAARSSSVVTPARVTTSLAPCRSTRSTLSSDRVSRPTPCACRTSPPPPARSNVPSGVFFSRQP